MFWSLSFSNCPIIVDISWTKYPKRWVLKLHLPEEEHNDDRNEQLQLVLLLDDDDSLGALGGKSYNVDTGIVVLLR